MSSSPGVAGHSQGPDSLTISSCSGFLFLISESLSQSSYVYKINSCVLTLLSCRVDEDEEIIVKAMSDYWVVGKKSDQRELYVILNQKNANLIEVNGK